MPRLRPASEPQKKPPVDPKAGEQQDELKLEGGDGEGEEEIVIVEEPEKKADEAAVALQKQIDALKKSEELQRGLVEQARREREEALRQSRELTARFEQQQKDMHEQEEVAVGSALAAAKAEADKAESDLTAAMNAGDNAAAADAQRRLARAEARLDRLELGKVELEQRKKEPPKKETPVQSGDPVDSFQLPDECKLWLKGHRQYLTDPEKAAELNLVHTRLVRQGLTPGHSQYLPEIEAGLQSMGSLPKPQGEEGDEGIVETQQPRQREKASIMSAPVSRETPSGSGQRSSTRITLTQAQKEFAKVSGITEVEYAKQLKKLEEAKSNGDYGERRYG